MIRDAIMPRGSVVGALIVGMLAWLEYEPHTCCDDSKVLLAEVTVSKFAWEAYPQWHRTFNARCPRSLYELTEFMSSSTTRDPWGESYRFECTDRGLVVWSLGEDRKPNTGDDIWSNR